MVFNLIRSGDFSYRVIFHPRVNFKVFKFKKNTKLYSILWILSLNDFKVSFNGIVLLNY